ncbi:ribonuclease H-like domain-containing protein [Desulfocurvus sp. DL9XJH121]
MLEHTFCHVPRVGATTERKYWDCGLRRWEDALGPEGDAVLAGKAVWVRQFLDESRERLAAGDARWFEERLPSGEAWRLYGAFRDRAAYVDIETTGLGFGDDHITTIALCAGGRIRTYVHGRNLEQFQDDIREYDLLVTFNGKCFDVPFIEREMKLRLDMAHVDLRYVMKKVGLSGGLKLIEKRLGLDRDGLEGVDGYFAVILWNEYQNTGNPAALETLLAYNAADVAGLERLWCHAYNVLAGETPGGPPPLEPAPQPQLPHTPDRELVQRLMARHGLWAGC